MKKNIILARLNTSTSLLMGWSMLAALTLAVPEARGQLPTGLTKSRWAMDDPEYAEKYAHGAEKSNIAGKLKQANDARFIDHHSGYYLSTGVTSIGKTANPLGSLEGGYTGYWESFVTNRVGLIAAANKDDYFVGGEIGMRFQSPTRLAPFVGTGLFTGVSRGSKPAAHDRIDNDDDGQIDERNEKKQTFDGALSAIYPETGLHFWWTSRTRLTGFGRYLITTDGRANDAWYFGFSIAVLSK